MDVDVLPVHAVLDAGVLQILFENAEQIVRNVDDALGVTRIAAHGPPTSQIFGQVLSDRDVVAPPALAQLRGYGQHQLVKVRVRPRQPIHRALANGEQNQALVRQRVADPDAAPVFVRGFAPFDPPKEPRQLHRPPLRPLYEPVGFIIGQRPTLFPHVAVLVDKRDVLERLRLEIPL